MEYGLLRGKSEIAFIAKEVCRVIGGGDAVVSMLIETAGAETRFGSAKDRSFNVGVGVTQFDQISLEDIKLRTRDEYNQVVKESFGINVDRLTLDQLRYSPLASIVCARLKYKLVPEIIPFGIELRAAYWKRYYNTMSGSGSVKHYLENNGYNMENYREDMEI